MAHIFLSDFTMDYLKCQYQPPFP